MDTIYSLLKRAKELKEKSQVDSITPEEVGKLHEDTLAYIASLEQSADGLGIKKVYQSKSAMEADTDPVETNGKTLRYGQLVSIYDDAHADSSENGNIYAYQKPGWLLVGKVSGLSVVQEVGDSATKVMSQAAVTRLIEESSAKGKISNITSSTAYTDGNYLAKGAIGSLVGIEHDYTGRLTSPISLEAGEVLECVIPCRNYVGYAALAEVAGDKYRVLAILDGKEENGNVTKISYTADKKMQVVVSGRFDKGWDIVKKTPTIEQQIANLSNSNNQLPNESLSGSISELNRDCEELLNVMTTQQPYVYNSANAVEFPALMIVTDEHGSTEATKRALQYAEEHNVISATLSLGDTGSPLDVYGDLAKNSKKPFLLTVGNHDMSDHYTSEQQLMENWYTKEHSTKLGANFHQKENKPFYYYDILLANGVHKKVRVINIMEHEKFYNPSPTSTEFISDLQYRWMCEILDSCDENTYVIITKHYPMEYADANVFCENFAPIKEYRCKKYESYSGHLAKIIDAWIHGKSVEFVGEAQFSHTFSRSHQENFICYLTGHMHEDNCFTVKDYPEQVCISFACTSLDKRQLVGDLVRTQGRLEDCVTCFSYNWNTKHVNLLRLGSNATADGRSRKYVSFKLPNIN